MNVVLPVGPIGFHRYGWFFLVLGTQLLRYFKLRAKYEKGFEDVLPANVRHAFDQEVIRLLPKRDQNGVRILLIECGSECATNDVASRIWAAL